MWVVLSFLLAPACTTMFLTFWLSASTEVSFGLVAPSILRLGLLPGPLTPHLSALLTKAAGCLRKLEGSIDIATYTQSTSEPRHNHAIPPHKAQGLHEPPTFRHPLQLWGKSVEALWRVSMLLEEKHPTWDGLSCRLLVWRSIVGERGSLVGEWARRETIRNLGASKLPSI